MAAQEGAAFAWRQEPAEACWKAMTGWVQEVLEPRGVTPAGPPVLHHATPWSTVARVATDAGSLWFKANGPGSRYEPGLLDALGRWAPDQVVVPVAVDLERAWSLSPDGGTTLRALPSAGSDAASVLDRWTAALAQYAELQREVAGQVPHLLGIGVPDLRPERLPALLDGLLDDPAVRSGLPADQLGRLVDLRPEYGVWCAELAAGGVPASLQHDDLHDANVFVAPGGYRFFDWGDASVAHPFGSLLVALRVAAFKFELPPGDAALHRLRDAYLEPWTGTAGAGRAELLRLSALAVRVTKVSRAFSWQKALIDVPAELAAEHVGSVPGWLEELLEPDLL